MTCIICGWRRASRKDRCAACYQFLRRNGKDRDSDDVMRSYERALDRLARILCPEEVA